MRSFFTLSVLALAATAVAKRGCAPDPNNEGSGWYQVVSGDTLNDSKWCSARVTQPSPEGHLADMNTAVAADFGSDADTLAAASGIANKDVIFPGDIITVPCA